MKRKTGLCAVLLFLFATAPLMLAQDLQSLPKPVLPPDVLGPRLIAWSQLQQPQPVSQAARSSDRQPQHTEQTSAGTIEQVGGKCGLKVASNSLCQLDDQEMTRQYEGKQVTIDGTLEADGESHHHASIETVSQK